MEPNTLGRFFLYWSKVNIVFRGDSSFYRYKMLSWCERNEVDYIVGLAKKKRLNAQIQELQEHANKQFQQTGDKQRLFSAFHYRTKSWSRERRIIAKAEYTDKGPNLRYIVANLVGDLQQLYDRLYCAKGEMENHIKEQQLYLFADRTSCHQWWANQEELLAFYGFATDHWPHTRNTNPIESTFASSRLRTKKPRVCF